MDFQVLTETPLIDDEQIQMLIETGEDAAAELIDELLGLFVDEADPKLDHLQDALQRDERTEAARDAHAIAGSSANLGALRLSKAARMMEHSVKDAAIPDLVQLLTYLRSCYRESVDEFRAQIERLRTRR